MLVAILVGVLGSGDVRADLVGVDAPIEITAEALEYHAAGAVYVADGDVVIRQSGRTLSADWMAISLETRRGVASGRVRLVDAEQVVEADFAQFDVDTLEGVLFDGRIDTGEGGFRVAGRELHRRSDTEYGMRSGGLTSCRCPEEDDREPWRIEAGTADLELGGYGTARNAELDVLGVPVAWLPWILFPVKTERESGLLLPDLAFGGRNGVHVGLPIFWAARHDVGVIAVPRYLQKRGFKGDAEVEYLVGERSGGSVAGSYVRDEQAIPGVTPYGQNRWAFRVEHDQHLPARFRARVDAKAVSDDLYLDDFDDQAVYRRDLFLRSKAFVSGTLGAQGRTGLLGALRWADSIQNPTGLDRDQTLLHRMPEAAVRVLPGEVPGLSRLGLQSSFDTDFTYFFQRERAIDTDPTAPLGPDLTFLDAGIAPVLGAADPTRGDGVFEPGEPLLEDGSRLVLQPRIARPIAIAGVADLTPEIGYAQSLYDGSLRGFQERGLFSARADLRTALVGTRRLGDHLAGEHRLEPFVRYTWIRTRNQASVPVYVPASTVAQERLRQLEPESYVRDPSDRIPDGNRLAVGFDNAFALRDGRGGVDPLRAEMWISYQHDFDQSGAGRMITGGRASWRGRLDGEASLSWDAGGGSIDEGLVGLRWALPERGPLRAPYLASRYRYLRVPPAVSALTRPEVNQIDAGLGFRLGDRLLLDYSIAYSLDDGERLAQTGTLLYASRCRCFTIGFDVVEDRTRQVFFQIRYSITGLGDGRRDPFSAARSLVSELGS
jgi:lipopolysaccharide assembly outer membrane protein LptD (OstA)